jgi:hypothetical protein
MSKRSPSCLDCGCRDFTQSERHTGRYLVTKDISFSCGARQWEFRDSESKLGRVEYEGCNCRS